MEDQAANSSYLLQMPLLVIEEILSNVLNLSNVSRTCKTLYEIVCDMEKRKRVVISIKGVATTNNSVRLTIDDDAVFASIMSSHRRITEIRLDLGYYRSSPVELNERQLERIIAVMTRFGTSVTSLMLNNSALSINEIIALLSVTPKLETLKFQRGKAFGNATKSLHLPNLKTLEITYYTGLLGVVSLFPAGLLNYFSYFEMGSPESEILKTVLTKQHNIKSLTIASYSDPIDLCVNHLQLEKLDLRMPCNNDQLVEVLHCHTNLKELRLSDGKRISVSAFEWICNNLKKLEVFEVDVDGHEPQGENLLVMLRELKNLRYLSTNVMPDDKVQFQINSLEKLKIQNDWSNNQDINEIVHSMTRTFTNLTDLEMQLQDFSQLSIVLSQCTKLIRLTSRIKQPHPQQLAEKRFPNIRQLSISTYPGYDFNVIISIARAMPNLKSLSMTYYLISVNVKAVKEFVCEKNSLEDLHVNYLEFDDNLSTSEDFVNSVRCLSDNFLDNLKTYRLRFFSVNGNSSTIRDILSNEFKVRYDPNNSSNFDLYKGDLTKFHDEFIN